MDPGSIQCVLSSAATRSWPVLAPMRACRRAPVGPSEGVFGGVERRRAAVAVGETVGERERRRPMKDGWWGDGVKGAFHEDRAMGMHKLVDSIDLL